MAAIKNAAQVALEANNSPQMIFQHYRQFVTEGAATRWFAILPDLPANVLLLSTSPSAPNARTTSYQAAVSACANI